MIALYSVNLRIMGKANVSLLGKETAFTYMETLGLDYAQSVFIVGLLATVVIGTLIYWFFGTEIGAAIRATGFNPQMIRAQGIDTNVMLLLGLFLSNALTAMAGAFIGMNNGFFDVGMGVGTIVIGLASVIIGEVLFGFRYPRIHRLPFCHCHRAPDGNATQRSQAVYECACRHCPCSAHDAG